MCTATRKYYRTNAPDRESRLPSPLYVLFARPNTTARGHRHLMNPFLDLFSSALRLMIQVVMKTNSGTWRIEYSVKHTSTHAPF